MPALAALSAMVSKIFRVAFVSGSTRRKFLRQLPDLRARFLRLMQALGRVLYIVARKGHRQGGAYSEKRMRAGI